MARKTSKPAEAFVQPIVYDQPKPENDAEQLERCRRLLRDLLGTPGAAMFHDRARSILGDIGWPAADPPVEMATTRFSER